jgi:hypothetical protein
VDHQDEQLQLAESLAKTTSSCFVYDLFCCQDKLQVFNMGAEVVFLPTTEDSEQAKDSSRILAQALANYSDDDRVRITIQGSSGGSNELVLPGDIMNLMLNVLTQVSQGNAFSLVPIHQEIST